MLKKIGPTMILTLNGRGCPHSSIEYIEATWDNERFLVGQPSVIYHIGHPLYSMPGKQLWRLWPHRDKMQTIIKNPRDLSVQNVYDSQSDQAKEKRE